MKRYLVLLPFCFLVVVMGAGIMRVQAQFGPPSRKDSRDGQTTCP